MLNKIKSWFVLVSFVFLSVLMPIKAYAFVPAMLGFIGAYDAAGAGALLGWRIGQGLIGLGIGGGIAAAAEDRYPGIGKCLMVVALGKPGLCQPTGWGRDSTGAPSPPATSSPSSLQDAAVAKCKDLVAANSTGGIVVTYQGIGPLDPPAADGSVGFRCYWSASNGNSGSWLSRAYPSCPAGYAMQSGACVLSNGALVKKPAGTPCQLVLTAGVVGYDPDNPSCPTTAPTTVTINGVKLTVSSDGKTITLVGPNGESGVIQIGSGSIGVVQNVPMNDDIGSPITQIGNTTLDNSRAKPIVTTQNVDYKKGQGQTTTGDPVITPPISCTMISNCNWANAQIQQQQLELQNQQLQSQNQTRDKVTSISDAMTQTREAPPLATPAQTAAAVDQLNAMKPDPAGYGGPITQILSHIGIPAGGGSCTLARTVTMFGRTFTINFLQPGFCETYQPVANWTVWGLVSLYAWNTLRRQHVSEA